MITHSKAFCTIFRFEKFPLAKFFRQIVIPQEARRFFGISPGDTLLILGNEVSGLVVTKPQVLSDLADEILGTTEEDHGNCDHV